MEDQGLHLVLQIPGGYGSEFASAWRLPDAEKFGFIDADAFVWAAMEAERGKFDAVFLADRAAVEDDLARSAPRSALEPVVLLAQMARETSRVGLVATSSTTYNYPYNVARQFRALDLVSGGRIGWNAVTTSSPLAALNFAEEVPTREYRYGRAHEFVTAVQALWGSWQDDALVLDAERGVFADMSKITPVGLVGQTLATRGPINLPPSAQGQPVVFQAGGGSEGLEIAGRYCNAIYSNSFTIEEAQRYWNSVQDSVRSFGRDPREFVIFSAIVTSIASSEREAVDRRARLDELGDLPSRVQYLQVMLGVTFEPEQLDEPLTAGQLAHARPHPRDPRSLRALELARRGLSIREIIAYGPIHYCPVAVGTPEQVADMLENWYRADIGNGFSIVPDVAADGVTDFVDQVVPLLQQRGLFRREYTGSTLREHLGVSYQNGLSPQILAELVGETR
jgi:FMN-dependent oxidoreductase (nitrilotriacetate monooxygenase family)